jgi:hypothetical protein
VRACPNEWAVAILFVSPAAFRQTAGKIVRVKCSCCRHPWAAAAAPRRQLRVGGVNWSPGDTILPWPLMLPLLPAPC